MLLQQLLSIIASAAKVNDTSRSINPFLRNCEMNIIMHFILRGSINKAIAGLDKWQSLQVTLNVITALSIKSNMTVQISIKIRGKWHI